MFTPTNQSLRGAACPGTNGPPSLAADEPWLGNPDFFLDVVSARRDSICAIGIAAATQSLRIGNCSYYLQGPVWVGLAATNAWGYATTRFPIPNDPALRGSTFFAQGFVLDPGNAVLGLAFTGSVRLVIGD